MTKSLRKMWLNEGSNLRPPEHSWTLHPTDLAGPARSCEKCVFKSYAINKGADQPAHLRSLISTFVVRCLNSIMALVSISEISRLYLISVAEQTSLTHTWSKISKDTFSHDVPHITQTALWADSWENLSFEVSAQQRLEPACSVTEASWSWNWPAQLQRLAGLGGFRFYSM